MAKNKRKKYVNVYLNMPLKLLQNLFYLCCNFLLAYDAVLEMYVFIYLLNFYIARLDPGRFTTYKNKTTICNLLTP